MILVRHGQSEFNVAFTATRRDPGIRDPKLTDEGRRQVRAAAAALAGEGLKRILASPYTRALETAEILAANLGLPVAVDPVVGERVAYACDIGSAPHLLAARWPAIAFDHLGDPWWPTAGESETDLNRRCAAFLAHAARLEDWREVVVVTHWGFIRGVTGLAVPNAAVLRIDPARPAEAVHALHMPEPVVPRP